MKGAPLKHLYHLFHSLLPSHLLLIYSPHLPLASSSSYLPSVQKDKRAFLASSSLPSSSVISRERERGIELDGMGWGEKEEGERRDGVRCDNITVCTTRHHPHRREISSFLLPNRSLLLLPSLRLIYSLLPKWTLPLHLRRPRSPVETWSQCSQPSSINPC